MSREARQLSNTGIYHITFRGMNHCHIFEEESDYLEFFKTLSNIKKEKPFKLYAYCLMSNHVHLLLHEDNAGDIITIMRRLLTKYAGWFNRKYHRCGSLVSNRYKSECVELDEYLINVVRYIHQNPISAGIVSKHEDYKWNSYLEYIGYDNSLNIVDKDIVLNFFSNGNKDIAIEEFKSFHMETNSVNLENNFKRIDEKDLYHIIKKELYGVEPNSLIKFTKEERDRKLHELRKIGLSIRQIERVTGISRGIIAKC